MSGSFLRSLGCGIGNVDWSQRRLARGGQSGWSTPMSVRELEIAWRKSGRQQLADDAMDGLLARQVTGWPPRRVRLESRLIRTTDSTPSPLSVPREVMLQRNATRSTNPFGKHAHERRNASCAVKDRRQTPWSRTIPGRATSTV